MADRQRLSFQAKAKITYYIGFKQGYLSKLGKKFKVWNRRWYVLSDQHLLSYSSPTDSEDQGQISLSEIKSIIQASDEDTTKPFCFKILTNTRSYIFMTENEKDLQDWLSSIRGLTSLNMMDSTFDSNLTHQLSRIRDFVSQVYRLISQANKVTWKNLHNADQQRAVSNLCQRIASYTISASIHAFMSAAKASAAKGGQYSGLISMSKQIEPIKETVELLFMYMKPLMSDCVISSKDGMDLEESLQSFLVFEDALSKGTYDDPLEDQSDSVSCNSDAISDRIVMGNDTLMSTEDISPLPSLIQKGSLNSRPRVLTATSEDSLSSGLSSPTHALGRKGSRISKSFQESLDDIVMSAKELGSLLIDLTNDAFHHGDYDSFLRNCKMSFDTCMEFVNYLQHAQSHLSEQHVIGFIHPYVNDIDKACADLFMAVRENAFSESLESVSALCTNLCAQEISHRLKATVLYFTYSFHRQQTESLMRDLGILFRQLLEDSSLTTGALRIIVTSCSEIIGSLTFLTRSVAPPWTEVSDIQDEESLLSYARSLRKEVGSLIKNSDDIIIHCDVDIVDEHAENCQLLTSSAFQYLRYWLVSHSNPLNYEARVDMFKFCQSVCRAIDMILSALRMDLASQGKGIALGDNFSEEADIWEESKDNITNIILYNGPNGESVKAATLNKLVERLTSEKKSDVVYMKTFITTYRSFTSPEIFLKKLRQRFHVPLSKLPPTVSFEEYKQNTIRPIQIRVFNVLKAWIEKSFDDFNEDLISSLFGFIDDFRAEGQIKQADTLTDLIKRKKSEPRHSTKIEFKISVLDAALATDITDPIHFMLEVDPELFAKEICMMDFKIFRAIKPTELLNQAWSKPKYRHLARNVHQLIERFNRLSRFVSTVIVSTIKLKDRTVVCSKVYQIAKALRDYNNFNSMFAVMSGLGTSAVHRLKFTKQGISRPLSTDMEQLEGLTKTDKSFTAIRQTLRSIDPPCIPYFGMYLTDLTFIDDGNPDQLNGLINFRKRDLTYSIISEIQQYQNLGYNFQENSSIRSLIIHAAVLEDKDLYEESLRREPRQATIDALE
eukprot:TRINITY_DN5235_c0_g1_i1.p1 TRINITY_DN5235_c0_g1~~TRINITY_DN5235_c0_g1_i1.p1  ORF type:complete len:1064 (+),score=174.50 TRINITY_DN5235_c0_g1_i1:133-3324(+)